jgi:hypothetical protein
MADRQQLLLRGALDEAVFDLNTGDGGGAAQIGAIAVSRAVAKTDSALADELLQSVRQTVATAATS